MPEGPPLELGLDQGLSSISLEQSNRSELRIFLRERIELFEAELPLSEIVNYTIGARNGLEMALAFHEGRQPVLLPVDMAELYSGHNGLASVHSGSRRGGSEHRNQGATVSPLFNLSGERVDVATSHADTQALATVEEASPMFQFTLTRIAARDALNRALADSTGNQGLKVGEPELPRGRLFSHLQRKISI